MFLDNPPQPFGAKMGYPVVAAGDVAAVFRRLQAYGINPAMAAERSFKPLHMGDLGNFQRWRYWVTYYLDRPLGLLYLTMWEGARVALFIERGAVGAGQVPRVMAARMAFAEELYQRDTILEGEFLEHAGQHYFIISDLLVHQGRVVEHSLSYKDGVTRGLIDTQYVHDVTGAPYRCLPKAWAEISQMSSYYQDYCRHLPFYGAIRGLCFRSHHRGDRNLVLPFRGGAGGLPQAPVSEDFPEWAMRPISEPPRNDDGGAVDPQKICQLLVIATAKADVYDLHEPVRERGDGAIIGYQRQGRAAITTLANSLSLQMLFEEADRNHRWQGQGHLRGLLLPCRYVERFGRWEPVSAELVPPQPGFRNCEKPVPHELRSAGIQFPLSEAHAEPFTPTAGQ